VNGFADLWPVPDQTPTVPIPQPIAAVFEARGETNRVYRERTFLIAALVTLWRHYEVDALPPSARGRGAWLGWSESFEPNWRWCVYLDLPGGQVSWHIHTSELPLFDGVPRMPGNPEYNWDGHSTDEKYRRIYEYVTGRKQ
jgi:hypothetical protein